MHDPVERATSLIRNEFAEPLTLDDIANAALMSRFHVSRIFHQVTGISPGRFLTAVRLNEAKRLLLTSTMSVADISCAVGYTSVGSFTTRFTDCVGVSPGKFRRLAELGVLGPIKPATARPARSDGSLTGTVRLESGGTSGPIFMGIFDRPIPQGQPNACQTVPAPGEWLLDPVPAGDWYVMAVTLDSTLPEWAEPGPSRRQMLLGASGPIHVRPTSLCDVELTLRPPRPTDPPVLLALPSLLGTLRPDRELGRSATS